MAEKSLRVDPIARQILFDRLPGGVKLSDLDPPIQRLRSSINSLSACGGPAMRVSPLLVPYGIPETVLSAVNAPDFPQCCGNRSFRSSIVHVIRSGSSGMTRYRDGPEFRPPRKTVFRSPRRSSRRIMFRTVRSVTPARRAISA